MVYAGDKTSTMSGYVQLLLKSWFDGASSKSFYSLDEYRKFVKE